MSEQATELFVTELIGSYFCACRRMSQTVDEDVIFDDVYELCEVIGRSAETTNTYKY